MLAAPACSKFPAIKRDPQKDVAVFICLAEDLFYVKDATFFNIESAANRLAIRGLYKNNR